MLPSLSQSTLFLLALKTCQWKHLQFKLPNHSIYISPLVASLYFLEMHVWSDSTSRSRCNAPMQNNKSSFRPGHTWGPSSYQWGLKSPSMWKEWLVSWKERAKETTAQQQQIKWMSPGEAQMLFFVILENWWTSRCFFGPTNSLSYSLYISLFRYKTNVQGWRRKNYPTTVVP